MSKSAHKAVARLEARGPLLSLGAGVVVDCCYLDRVELAGRFADASPLRLLLSLGDTEVGVDCPGPAGEAESLIVEVARFTRAAPIHSEEQYDQEAALLRAVANGTYQQPPVLTIDGERVTVESGLLSTGVVGYVVDEIESAATRGQCVELIGGNQIPAAILLLAVAAASPPSRELLEQRLTEYRERYRSRSAPC